MMKNFSPNLIIMVVVLVLVGGSAVIFFNRQKNTSMFSDQKTPETSESPTLAASAEYSEASSSDVDYIESYNVEVASSPLPSPNALSEYIYPGADVLTTSLVKIELQSTQSPEKITDWYKEKIRQLLFNAKSFSQTNTNGVILNKLSAAKPGEKIEITIKKDQNASKVTITVDRP